ncbi:hypothetical protein AV521_39750 [Streptomyces sp. IMTB 2501]|uniref:hypothetical protein n=1 Tax=Streptomyces sp. IMTB 2501 TaxID=1776340 RepID=UPI00096EDB1C|nr:hypothetical protein [Streptomyces sp. IMTB 2501]OLZ63138.1 hypothetical protein AV521_39750 [Streptomyces sp. IMTB 2501]
MDAGGFESGGTWPGLRLDEYLDELQVRVGAMRSTRDRVHSLLEAVLAVGQGPELPDVLRYIVEAAVPLVDAEYGALGVIGDDRKPSAFVPVGMSDELRQRLGLLPQDHGALDLLIRNPEPVRIAEFSEHPAGLSSWRRRARSA